MNIISIISTFLLVASAIPTNTINTIDKRNWKSFEKGLKKFFEGFARGMTIRHNSMFY